MERFNLTLKGMLRRTADDEGKYWDKLIPYLFAYHKVPQASTGFFPFEDSRNVRGPLDVLKGLGRQVSRVSCSQLCPVNKREA